MENIKTHGRNFVGTVINTNMQKTATIEWSRQVFIKKFERFMTKRTRIKAHNPEEMSAKTGDIVNISECRPLSKTKKFIITKKLGVDTAYVTAKETMKEGLTRKEEKEEEK
jgi:small subunit ribosomal protein S17